MEPQEQRYLCQVNGKVSCGACCGLYNLQDLSQEKLEKILWKRTEEFVTLPRSEEELFRFKRRHKGEHRLSRPFPQFHHCPFLGLIGKKKTRVGCLLHPSAPGNNGNDYRSMSWYGEKACATYFCPATHILPERYATIVKQGIDSWYDYGLIITEHVLIVTYFKEVESRIGRNLDQRDFSENRSAKDALTEFARLKHVWPYRRADSTGPCNYFFNNGLYPRPAVFRKNSNIPVSSHETILKELDSGFSSELGLREAEQIVEKLILQTVEALD